MEKMVRTLSTLFTCFFSLLLGAQDLTGVWRGSFYNEYEYLFTGAKYRYEVQIKTTGLQAKGVTYSYQTTRFYGKASMVGKWSPSTKDLTLVENKMLDLKIVGGGDGCLMTCYLQYRKDGDREYLEGTYSSVNMKNDTAQCGGGVVRLEKVVDSDFALEDFLKQDQKATAKGGVKPGQDAYLIKKPVPVPPKTNSTTTPSKPNSGSTAKSTPSKTPVPKSSSTPKTGSSTKPNTSSSTAKTPSPKPSTDKNQPAATAKTTTPKPATSAAKPSVGTAKTSTPAKSPANPSTTSSGTVTGSGNNTAKTAPPVTPIEPAKPPVASNKVPQTTLSPAPAVIKNRKNELVETIATASRKLEISFYDNGEIDGDTISVYANNRLIVSRKGLSAEPITISINLDETVENQEIVMVAENLGSIPPNTALMIVQAGAQRYAVRLSSNEQKNALVRFRYDANALK